MPPADTSKTDTSKKAEADAAKMAEDLEAKRVAEAAKLEAVANAEEKAKAELLAKREADLADAKAAAAEKASPSDALSLDRAERDQIKAEAARVFAALQDHSVGLGPMAASILAAHVLAKVPGSGKMGATQAQQWAQSFKQATPIAWYALRTGNLVNFAAAMRRSGVETLTHPQLEVLASAIRG